MVNIDNMEDIMNTNKKHKNIAVTICVLSAVIAIIVLCSSGCSKYNERKIIGMSSLEAEEKYGEFYKAMKDPNTYAGRGQDGLYRNCDCGYLMPKKPVIFDELGYVEYFMIHFNENGIADKCYYDKVV